MKNGLLTRGFLLIWGALLPSVLLLGCQRLAGQAAISSTATPTIVVEVPAGVLTARDAVLAYISQEDSDQAPVRGLNWLAEYTTPEGLVGSSTWQFTAGDWVMTISYPVVHPDLVIYKVILANRATKFEWRGRVNPAGEVLETPEQVLAARDVALGYLIEHYGDKAPGVGLAWTEKRTTPEGLIGSENYEFTAEDWVVTLSYPIVHPDLVVYTVKITNPKAGFDWEGTVDAGGKVTEQSMEGTLNKVEAPDPIRARDTVLAHLREKHGDQVPPPGLVWKSKPIRAEGVLGVEAFQYTSGDWECTVSYPIVRPDLTVYTVGVMNQVTGFVWRGEVDATGQVTEKVAPPAPPAG